MEITQQQSNLLKSSLESEEFNTPSKTVISSLAKVQIVQSVRLTQSDLLTLNSKPVIICPANEGFINIFEKATVTYIYTKTPFSNVDGVMGFYLVPTQEDTPGGSIPAPFLVSDAFSGQSIMGTSQGTSASFIAANPYPGQMSKLSLSKAAIVLTIGQGVTGADPLGGDPGSMLNVSVVYSILAQ